MFRKCTVSLLLLSAFGVATAAAADKQYGPGVSDTEIKIGNTNPYSGPASAYGTIGRSEAAYFAMINDQGGINGRKINFISRDDGYSPPKTVEVVRQLVEQDHVLFLFQTLGTPPNIAIQGYLNDNKVPQLFVATGATRATQSTSLGRLGGSPIIKPRPRFTLVTSLKICQTAKSQYSIRTMIPARTTSPAYARD
jgi:ABC-type branched-subunit amino acid transport system substrate-binding protein